MMNKKFRWLGLVLAGMLCAALMTSGSASALPLNPPRTGMVCLNGPTFNLVATSGTIQTPDGNSVFMWSYADGSGQFQYPGPVLCVTEGQNVTVNLTNNLPEPVSIVFPGQDAQVNASGGGTGLMTREAAANGGTVSYSFVASQPGTYLYESGTDVAKQVEMGLYGALVVRPSMGANYAYDNAATQFDPTREYMILLGEVDIDLHHAVEIGGTYDFTKLHNRYYTVNGRSFPDTLQANGSALLPTQPYGALVKIQPTTPTSLPAMIRMLDAGADNHPFHPHGNHLTQIGQDGRLFLSPGDASASTERFNETIGSGQTEDYLIRWDNVFTDTAGVPFNDDWSPINNPLPVAQPNYANLTFKDGNTWYSGNPYLGYKGTLPVGTTSQNICGEWYFPWHSHALNEFTNYDEGFGGMATLLRVDPFGGCFTTPAATTRLAGTLNSGSVSNLAFVDSLYYRLNSTTTGTRTTDWYAQFTGVPAGAANLKVTYTGNDSINSVTQSIYIWNWTTSTWFQIAGPTTVGTTDVTVTSAPIAAAANYIGTGTNSGQVRVRVLSTGGATNFVTSANFMKLVYDAP